MIDQSWQPYYKVIRRFTHHRKKTGMD